MAMVSAREWREIPGRYNLIGSKCTNCGKIFFPSRSFCPDCRRASIGKIEPFKLSRKGEVYSFAINHEYSGFNDRMMPYAVAFIKNDDGVMLAGQLVDVEFDKIQIGMRVKAVMRKLNEDGEAVSNMEEAAFTAGYTEDGTLRTYVIDDANTDKEYHTVIYLCYNNRYYAFNLAIGNVDTAIKSVDNDAAKAGRIYDLSGREVKNPDKGIYIQNGKKFVVK